MTVLSVISDSFHHGNRPGLSLIAVREEVASYPLVQPIDSRIVGPNYRLSARVHGYLGRAVAQLVTDISPALTPNPYAAELILSCGLDGDQYF
jgi:hypothetical protein